MARTVFQTHNSDYEVDEESRRFRRKTSRRGDTGSPWQPYASAGPIVLGERVRFVLDGPAATAGKAAVWTTTPVCRILRSA